MKIDHIAVYVNDLEAIKSFYELYFGVTANQMYHNTKTGLQTYFLTFPDGGRLEIMTRPNITENNKAMMQSGYIHLAVSVGSKEKVDELTKRLQTDGYEVLSGPRTTGDGYYESCILDPERNQIEIVA